jgi:3-phosphoshikimate 1-carboxyvinyltransferase
VTGGEPAADLTVRFAEMDGVSVRGETVVRAIDEFPIWTIAASQAAGESAVSDAAELRVKEVDRIGVLAGELRRLGAVIDERPDGLSIYGPFRFSGGTVDSHDDHRLAMALAVAGLAATSETIVRDAGCAADSFPGFVETMRQLGANMAWRQS